MSPYRVSAGALIEHSGKLLLVRHTKPDAYDFWVAPGGGVKGSESYEEAAKREVMEETGLSVEVGELLYIEDLVNPQCRYVKFWFQARYLGGDIDVSHPEARLEHVVQAGWYALHDLPRGEVFPSVLHGRYEQDREAGFPGIVRLPLRQMSVW